MGIVPVFDPTTGASGGPAPAAGGGIDPDPAGTPINLNDGSWSLYDPLSMVQSVAYDSGTNQNLITLNAAGPTNDLVWTATGATHSGARWYRALSIDGVAMTTDDPITGIYTFGPDHAVTDYNSGGVCGICEDPTTTVTADIRGTGAGFIYFGGGNIQCAVWTNNNATFESSNTLNRYSRLVNFFGPSKARYVAASTFDASGNLRNGLQRDANLTLTASVPVYEIVGIGTRTGADTITLNDQIAIFAWSTFLRQVGA